MENGETLIEWKITPLKKYVVKVMTSEKVFSGCPVGKVKVNITGHKGQSGTKVELLLESLQAFEYELRKPKKRLAQAQSQTSKRFQKGPSFDLRTGNCRLGRTAILILAQNWPRKLAS